MEHVTLILHSLNDDLYLRMLIHDNTFDEEQFQKTLDAFYSQQNIKTSKIMHRSYPYSGHAGDYLKACLNTKTFTKENINLINVRDGIWKLESSKKSIKITVEMTSYPLDLHKNFEPVSVFCESMLQSLNKENTSSSMLNLLVKRNYTDVILRRSIVNEEDYKNNEYNEECEEISENHYIHFCDDGDCKNKGAISGPVTRHNIMFYFMNFMKGSDKEIFLSKNHIRSLLSHLLELRRKETVDVLFKKSTDHDKENEDDIKCDIKCDIRYDDKYNCYVLTGLTNNSISNESIETMGFEISLRDALNIVKKTYKIDEEDEVLNNKYCIECDTIAQILLDEKRIHTDLWEEDPYKKSVLAKRRRPIFSIEDDFLVSREYFSLDPFIAIEMKNVFKKAHFYDLVKDSVNNSRSMDMQKLPNFQLPNTDNFDTLNETYFTNQGVNLSNNMFPYVCMNGDCEPVNIYYSDSPMDTVYNMTPCTYTGLKEDVVYCTYEENELYRDISIHNKDFDLDKFMKKMKSYSEDHESKQSPQIFKIKNTLVNKDQFFLLYDDGRNLLQSNSIEKYLKETTICMENLELCDSTILSDIFNKSPLISSKYLDELITSMILIKNMTYDDLEGDCFTKKKNNNKDNKVQYEFTKKYVDIYKTEDDVSVNASDVINDVSSFIQVFNPSIVINKIQISKDLISLGIVKIRTSKGLFYKGLDIHEKDKPVSSKLRPKHDADRFGFTGSFKEIFNETQQSVVFGKKPKKECIDIYDKRFDLRKTLSTLDGFSENSRDVNSKFREAKSVSDFI